MNLNFRQILQLFLLVFPLSLFSGFELMSAEPFHQVMPVECAPYLAKIRAVNLFSNRTETIEGISKNYSYTYDNSDRLTEVFENGNLVEEFTFDTNDNVSERKVNGVTTIATFDEQDRLISRGTKLYRYNDHGQLNEIADNVTGDLTNLDYDVFGALRQVSMPDGTIVDYINATGRRTQRQVNNILKRFGK